MRVLREFGALYFRHSTLLAVVAAVVLIPLDGVAAALDATRGWADAPVERWLPATLVLVLAYVWATVSVTAFVHSVRSRAAPWAPMSVYRPLAPVLGAATAASLVACAGILVGLVALVVPGLLLATWWSLIIPVIVIERVPWRSAFRRSRELVRSRPWFVFLALVSTCAVTLTLDYLIVFRLFGPEFWNAWIGGVLADIVLVPASAVLWAAIYYDLREADPAVTPATPT